MAITLNHDMVNEDKFYETEYLPRVKLSPHFVGIQKSITPNGDLDIKITLSEFDKSLYEWLVEILGEEEFISVE